jgi:hypothetical protein
VSEKSKAAFVDWLDSLNLSVTEHPSWVAAYFAGFEAGYQRANEAVNVKPEKPLAKPIPPPPTKYLDH